MSRVPQPRPAYPRKPLRAGSPRRAVRAVLAVVPVRAGHARRARQAGRAVLAIDTGVARRASADRAGEPCKRAARAGAGRTTLQRTATVFVATDDSAGESCATTHRRTRGCRPQCTGRGGAALGREPHDLCLEHDIAARQHAVPCRSMLHCVADATSCCTALQHVVYYDAAACASRLVPQHEAAAQRGSHPGVRSARAWSPARGSLRRALHKRVLRVPRRPL